MKNNIISNYNILSLHRYTKRIIAITTDTCLSFLCTWLAFTFRLEDFILFKDFSVILASTISLIAIPIFWIFGLYRTIFRYTSLSLIFTIFASISVYSLLYFLILGAYGVKGIPRSIGLLQPIIFFFAILSSRLVFKYIIDKFFNTEFYSHKKNVLVYGAGNAGRQLVSSLENNSRFNVVGFIDDNKSLQNQILLGKSIYSPKKLENLSVYKKINFVFLALPGISRKKRNIVIKKLEKYKLKVKTLPSVSEIVDGKISLSNIRDFNIDDLLNRDQVKPDFRLLNKNINAKTVLVTGAGGSIGSEICRQVVKLKPTKLLLLELNEFSLYKIFEELKNYNQNLTIHSLLANVQDKSKLEDIFETFNVDTVYHAAAYKHVPLVEENICESVKNNVFSSLAVAEASVSKKVSSLVLISSDKAVRPTNIMGATKRISELCVQAVCENNKDVLINFSIVRFGNVLESSGSVIPKFKEQIQKGGPITLTHEEVTRYFMTLIEAAELVIQAGAMGKNSEVFVLDMGKSVKIKDLISKMIILSGFTIKDKKNPEGDIEIKNIGLRPGEKLYEELLIGNNPQITKHPKIMKIKENFISYEKLCLILDNLKQSIERNDAKKVKDILVKSIKSYKTNSEIVDSFHIQKLSIKRYKKNNLLATTEKNKLYKIK